MTGLRSYCAGVSLLLVAGCAPDMPLPEISAVEPTWGYNGEETPIEVLGQRFYPQVQVSGEDDILIDRQFRIWLEDGGNAFELEAVALQDYTRLAARVPEGLEPGIYDLVVRSPATSDAIASDLFTVTDTRADHFALSSDSSTYQVNALASVEIELQDPEDLSVSDRIEVKVVVSGAGDVGSVVFSDTLEDQQALQDEVGIQGWLGYNGRGQVTLTSTTPESIWVTVEPSDPSSVIESAVEQLTFTAGDVASVQLDLPSTFYTPRAGVPFDLNITLFDAWGNQTDGVGAALLVYEVCGDALSRFQQGVQLVDTTLVEDIILTGSTTREDCTENWLEASGTASGTFIEGASRAFDVSPGDVVELRIEATPITAVAGEDLVYLRVTAVDAWNNPVPDYTATLEVRDSIGGLDPEGNIGEQSCSTFLDGVAHCQVILWKAGENLSLSIESDEGTQGELDGLTVLAGTATTLVVDMSLATVVAGEENDLTLRAADAYGNTVLLEVGGVDTPSFSGSVTAPDCVYQGALGADGEQRYSCVLTAAGSSHRIDVSVASLGISGSTDLFEVINGELSQLDIDLGGTVSMVAGQTLAASFSGMDAWRNPYVVQSASSVEIFDDSGEIEGVLVVLDSTGSGSSTFVLTRAWTNNHLTAELAGTTLGTSSAFDVTPDVLSGFDVSLSKPWAWLGEEFIVSVEAMDAYGNTIPSFDETLTVSSTGGLGTATEIVGFTDGQASGLFSFDQAGLQDILLARWNTTNGLSSAIDAIESDCVGGPVAELQLDGKAELVHCLNSGSTPSTQISLASSLAGNAALSTYHYDLGSDGWSSSSSDAMTHTWSEAGAWHLQGVVVDIAACGSLATADLWVAEYDGEPAGPITLVAADSSLQAADAATGMTTVDLLANDCAGDPSSGTVLVQTDLGALSAAGSAVTASGQGLSLVLDTSGEGQLSWSVVDQLYAGTATLQAGVASGAAYGEVTVEVDGDAASPTVLWINPVGTTGELFDSVDIQFSEAMLPQNFTSSTVTITDPDGSEVSVSAYDLSSDETWVSLQLDGLEDAGSGIWQVSLSANVRDDSGNRLDGLYSGSASAFTLEFGAVLDTAAEVLSCQLDTDVFRPDGDPGSGEEADEVNITVSADAVPHWWELWVMDGDGETRWLTRQSASAASETLTWDGRGLDGHIAASQRYTLTIAALDEHWNVGTTCEVDVSLNNLVKAPE